MTVGEALRYLKARGIIFSTKNGTGHQCATNPTNGQWTIFPMHGKKHEIPPGTWNKMLKDLGLK